MEWLDEVDERGEPTGRVFERTVVHDRGIRHRTSHVWIKRGCGADTEILLQKRSRTKDSFPGDYDISSAGHIPAGQGYVESAMRELEEELGIMAEPEDLHVIGNLTIQNELEFYGKPFRDNQITCVFYMERDVDPDRLTLQESEVESVMWIRLADCIEQTRQGLFPCLFPKELDLLREAFSA